MPDGRGNDRLVALKIVIMLGKTPQRLGDIAGDRRFFRYDQSFSHTLIRLLTTAPNLLLYRLLATLLKLCPKSTGEPPFGRAHNGTGLAPEGASPAQNHERKPLKKGTQLPVPLWI